MLTRSRKGFTLLELVVTLVILGVIALIAIPSFEALIDGSAEKSALTVAQSVARNANALADLRNDNTLDTDLETAEGEVPGSISAYDAGGTTGTGDTQDGEVEITITSGDSTTEYACVTISANVAVAAAGACV